MTLFYFWWQRPPGEREHDPLGALEAAVEEMERLYGTIEVPWGRVHRIRRGSLDLPIAGSKDPSTLWMAHGPMDERGIIYTNAGSSFVMLVKLGPKVEAYSLLPYGISEDSSSPHYADQAPLMSRGELKRAWFYRDKVLAHAESVLILSYTGNGGDGSSMTARFLLVIGLLTGGLSAKLSPLPQLRRPRWMHKIIRTPIP